MRTFADTTGREWKVDVNVGTCKRVKTLLPGTDLLDVAGGDLLCRLASDPILLCDVLYVVVKPQADAEGVSDEAFGQALGGDALEAATTALLEALSDFFPSAKRRVLQKALVKLRALENRVADAAEARLEGKALERELDALLAGSGASSTDTPESLA